MSTPKIVEKYHTFKTYLREERAADYPISYRLVICHAMRNLMSKEHLDETSVKDVLRELAAIEGSKIDYLRNEFLQIAFLRNNTDLVVIDKSNGCYPLVLYTYQSQDSAPRKKDRVSAFFMSVKDVQDSLTAICSYFSKFHDAEWDEAFQKDLEKEANFPLLQ